MADDDRSAFERNQHGQDMEPEVVGEDEAGDPAAAFEALRATVEDLSADLRREMITIRKGVEAAFDQFEKVGAPIDCRADLGNMLEQFAEMTERIHGVEKSPLLRHGPDHYAREFSRTGDAMVRAAAEQFQHESRVFRSAAQDLINQTESARDRHQQQRWLVGVGVAGILLGALLLLFGPRVFSHTVAPRVASLVMGDTAWQAGMSMMMFASPESWSRVASADKLIEANKDAVADCRAAAVKTGKEQKCTVIVPAPEKTQ